MIALGGQEMTPEHCVVNPEIRPGSQCCLLKGLNEHGPRAKTPKTRLETQFLVKRGTLNVRNTYWILGVRNSKSGLSKFRCCFYEMIPFTYHGLLP